MIGADVPDFVSIITPCYNSANYIRATIESVLKQTHAAFELIIVDDGSSDDSREIVEAYQQTDSRIILLKQSTNMGPARARNAGIEIAQGRYIAFIDSDDIWLEQKLERQIAFMKREKAPISFTAYKRIDANGQLISELVQVPNRIDYKTLLKSNVMGCLTVIYDTSLVGKQFMPDIQKRQDHGLWLKILRNGHIAYGLNEDLARYRIGPYSVSRNKVLAAMYQWKLYREIEKLSILRSSYFFIQYAILGFKKHNI